MLAGEMFREDARHLALSGRERRAGVPSSGSRWRTAHRRGRESFATSSALERQYGARLAIETSTIRGCAPAGR